MTLRYASLRYPFCAMAICVMRHAFLPTCVMPIPVMPLCVMAVFVMAFCVLPLSMMAICRIGLLPFSFGLTHSWFGRFYFKYWSLNFVIDIPTYRKISLRGSRSKGTERENCRGNEEGARGRPLPFFFPRSPAGSRPQSPQESVSLRFKISLYQC